MGLDKTGIDLGPDYRIKSTMVPVPVPNFGPGSVGPDTNITDNSNIRFGSPKNIAISGHLGTDSFLLL